MMQKSPPWRSKKYLAWVKTLPCCLCGCPSDDPHHVKGIGNLSGAGLKASDIYTMPLCRRCHNRIHDPKTDEDQSAANDQFYYICRTVERAVKEGILVIGEEQDKPCYVCQKKITGYGK